ncbi:Hypothetical predicted protein [Olea europaea subsp. europaea]|uniref:Uncharacterized protein n=1 Tax=Olea europaea subsp. europaea TaxID=158383 RepID=A0A8S0PQE9_OLEEU|nr:Hypothetical predicted protein [Olea europaea subsp. europaea]
MCRPCWGPVLVAAGTQPDFQAFLGSLWARCAGHVRDASYREKDAALFSSISRQFVGTICRQYSGRFLATPCPGWSLIFRHFKVVSGSRCAGHVQDASEPCLGWSLIFRHFKAVFGHNVHAMSGMRPDRCRNAT